jgi:hypothetical protein
VVELRGPRMAMERSSDVNMFDRKDWTMKDGSFVV